MSWRQILELGGVLNKKKTAQRNCTRTLRYIWQEELRGGTWDLRTQRVRKAHLCEANGCRVQKLLSALENSVKIYLSLNKYEAL